MGKELLAVLPLLEIIYSLLSFLDYSLHYTCVTVLPIYMYMYIYISDFCLLADHITYTSLAKM